MKKLAATLLLVTATAARADVDPALTARMDALLGQFSASGAIYVARAVDVVTGREIYLHDPDRPVAPASNMKLPNVAAALDRFGPNYLWRTYLALDDNNLWLIGTGDPSPGDKRLEDAAGKPRFAILADFAAALKSRGIHHLQGDLIIDDGAFDDERVGATWPKSELTDSWCAPLTALALNGNCIDVNATPGHLDVTPPTHTVQLIDHTRTTGQPAELELERQPDANTFIATGRITAQTIEHKAIVDPGLFFADAFRTRLEAEGITLTGQVRRATRDEARQKWNQLKQHDTRDGRILAVHETRLQSVLQRIDKQSQNLFADALCKLQGQAWDREHGRDLPGSWSSGGQAIHAFLQRQNIDDSKYISLDGSGMSPDNRVTARLLSDLLLKMLSHKYAAEFQATLSIAGIDGTLDDRLTDLKGKFHGKSGTITATRALSGYLTTDDNRLLVVSLLYNNAPDPIQKQTPATLDNAIRLLAKWKAN